MFDSYQYKQTEPSSKVNADIAYLNQIEKTLKDPKSLKKINFLDQRRLEAELIVGKSNQPTHKAWIKELPTIKCAF